MLEGRKKVLEANHVPCPKCGKLKREGQSLKSHLKKCGTGPARVTCTQCDMEFKVCVWYTYVHYEFRILICVNTYENDVLIT